MKTAKKYTYLVVAAGTIKAKVNTKAMADRMVANYDGCVVICRVPRLFSKSGQILNNQEYLAACIGAVNEFHRVEAAGRRDVLMS
jgi:hypothetical protein